MSRPRTDWRSDPTIQRYRQNTQPTECTGVLVSAAVALATISDVEEYIDGATGSFDEQSLSTFDGGSARGAAAWSLFVSSVAILSPVAVIFACCCSVFEDHYVQYFTVTSVFCFITAISLLAGGIANIIVYVDNDKLWSDRCSSLAGNNDREEICLDLESLSSSEIACGVLSIVSSLVFIILGCTVAYHGYHKHEKNLSPSHLPSYERTSTTSRAGIQTSTAQGMEPITPSVEQPWAPSSAPPLSFQPPLSVQPSAPPLSVQPSAPPTMEASEPSNPSTNESPPVPKHDSNAPPSYESTLTELPTYETALTDTNPVN